MSKQMARRVHQSLTDEDLQSVMGGRGLPRIGFRQRMQLTGVDFDGLSAEIRRVKEESIANLPQLVEQFKAEATGNGCVVYEARDAEDADNYVLQLAEKHGVKLAVKSKSMLTEEIELRQYLERAGIEVQETDIGEWIVQLAGEKPVHMVGPALHKTLQQVADLMSRATGKDLPPEPQALLQASRDALRRYYIDADMGISGGNIVIAETGTVVILTNEANGCLSTTLPPLYAAVVGYEKLVSGWEDAAAILRLLSRSTMGMKLPVYVSHISGPSKTDAIAGFPRLGGQGPWEMHVVLVDNGRLTMRESDDFREALYCIKCGACLGACPVFTSVAGHTYGHIYQGGIGAVLTAFINGMDQAKDPASLCMGCLACKEVCPAQIDIPGLINRLRARSVAEDGLSLKSRLALRHILKRPGRLAGTIKLGRYLQRPFTDEDSIIRNLPYPLKSLTQTISLPAISDRPLRDRLPHDRPAGGKTNAGVAFYAGCLADYGYPELGEDVVKVLRESGIEPYYPPGQTCCGAPAFFNGDTETTIEMAKINIAALEAGDPGHIVTVCPGCAGMLQREYPSLLADEPQWQHRAQGVAGKIRDFSQLVLELTAEGEKKPARNRKITYHDPCHLKRGLGIYSEPRELLEREGFELVEMNGADACCGFGGETVLNYPELSDSVMRRKLAAIEATGVDTVVTNCVPCILQLRGGLDKRQSKIRVIHSAQLLAEENKAADSGTDADS
jgi:iron-sulfur cluster protein